MQKMLCSREIEFSLDFKDMDWPYNQREKKKTTKIIALQSIMILQYYSC
jgi:hypothetical protein